jgi:BirA family transcriptional regulator, biotin operon repressor / biotin---[acetyl-CoA-carboxylase] ligase
MIGSTIYRIEQTKSTNNYAATQLLTNSLPDGSVIITDSQIDGRGQGLSKWESESGKNLTFSIVLYPDFIEVGNQFELSKVISLGVVDFLSSFTPAVSIKWPNDIYIGNSKVAGILIENSIRINKISSSIIGIGLNVNQQLFKGDAPNPVSLSQITQQSYDLEEMLLQLCAKIDFRYRQLAAKEILKIDDDYAAILYRRDLWAPYLDENGNFEGRLLGVDQIGRLQIETRLGEINRYQFKEVTFL